MSAEFSTPDSLWIITEEVAETSTTTISGARSSGDTGGLLGRKTTEEQIIVTKEKDKVVITRRKVEVTKLKQEMRGFIQAMRECLDEADDPDSKIRGGSFCRSQWRRTTEFIRNRGKSRR